jgi:RHS repeat-associated protein
MVNQTLPTSTATLTATAAATPTATHSPAATITPQHSATPAPGQMALQARYFYDGDGNLVKSIINNVVTYYVGRHYHKTVDGANVSIKKFYAIGMSQIAVRTDGELNWILTDHLSSASVSASADGTLVSEVKYSAYGEIRYQSGSLPTKYQYTGQLSQMAEIGLYHYGARFYDPALSHFVSADTIVPSAGNVLDWNPSKPDRAG